MCTWLPYCLQFFFLFSIHFIIPFGKFGPPYLVKATAAARRALPSPASACWVFLCFRNPPNSNMDYRIFNVRIWSFLCVRTHTGVGHTNNELALGKTDNFFLCSWWRWNLGSLDFESDAVPIEPPHHPFYCTEVHLSFCNYMNDNFNSAGEWTFYLREWEIVTGNIKLHDTARDCDLWFEVTQCSKRSQLSIDSTITLCRLLMHNRLFGVWVDRAFSCFALSSSRKGHMLACNHFQSMHECDF